MIVYASRWARENVSLMPAIDSSAKQLAMDGYGLTV